MFKIKKIPLTVAAVLVLKSSMLLAGAMGNICSSSNVTMPCSPNMWEIGATALYLQPIYSFEGSMPAAAFTADDQTIGRTSFPSYGWGLGFMVEAAYHSERGEDLNLNWYHFNNTSTITRIYQTANEAPEETVKLQPQWNALNAEFGRRINLDELQNLRFHFGAQYARIRTQSKEGPIFLIDGSLLVSQTETTESNFNGVGPRGGLDINYEFIDGFSVYGKGAVALLVGSASFDTDRVLLKEPLNGSANSGSRRMVIPELEAKLGLQYNLELGASGGGYENNLVFDLGWMGVNYFGAQMYGIDTYLTPYPRRSEVSQTNFALQGLYFGVKWIGNGV